MSKETATQAKKAGEVAQERLTDLNNEGVTDITAELRRLLADTFVLYLKTKNFHWHMSGNISGTITCCSTNTLIRSLP
jgi:starvation-inducible DNA-binding protein